MKKSAKSQSPKKPSRSPVRDNKQPTQKLTKYKTDALKFNTLFLDQFKTNTKLNYYSIHHNDSLQKLYKSERHHSSKNKLNQNLYPKSTSKSKSKEKDTKKTIIVEHLNEVQDEPVIVRKNDKEELEFILTNCIQQKQNLEAKLKSKELKEKELQEKIEIAYQINEYLKFQLSEKDKTIKKLQDPNNNRKQKNYYQIQSKEEIKQLTQDNESLKNKNANLERMLNDTQNEIIEYLSKQKQNDQIKDTKSLEKKQQENQLQNLQTQVKKYQKIVETQLKIFNGIFNEEINEDQLIQSIQIIIQANTDMEQKLEYQEENNQSSDQQNLAILEYFLKQISEQAVLKCMNELLLSEIINQSKSGLQNDNERIQNIRDYLDNLVVEEDSLVKQQSNEGFWNVEITSDKQQFSDLMDSNWKLRYYTRELENYSSQIGILGFNGHIMQQMISNQFQQENAQQIQGNVYIASLKNYLKQSEIIQVISMLMNDYHIQSISEANPNYLEKLLWNEFWIKYFIKTSSLIILVFDTILYQEAKFIDYLLTIKQEIRKELNIAIMLNNNNQVGFTNTDNLIIVESDYKIDQIIKELKQQDARSFIDQLNDFVNEQKRYFFEFQQEPQFQMQGLDNRNQLIAQLVFNDGNYRIKTYRKHQFTNKEDMLIQKTEVNKKVIIKINSLDEFEIQEQPLIEIKGHYVRIEIPIRVGLFMSTRSILIQVDCFLKEQKSKTVVDKKSLVIELLG